MEWIHLLYTRKLYKYSKVKYCFCKITVYGIFQLVRLCWRCVILSIYVMDASVSYVGNQYLITHIGIYSTNAGIQQHVLYNFLQLLYLMVYTHTFLSIYEVIIVFLCCRHDGVIQILIQLFCHLSNDKVALLSSHHLCI